MIRSGLFANRLIVLGLLFSICNLFSQDHRRDGAVPVETSTRFQLHAELASDTAKAGSPIVATLRLKNISSRRGQFLEMGSYVDYELLVTDHLGKEALRTESGNRLVEDERGATAAFAQSRVSVDELLGILDIHVFRVRVPNDSAYVWSIEVLKPDAVKPLGRRPTGLSQSMKLLALRDVGSDQLEFTLPDAHGSSKGQLKLCNEGVTCEGQYSISWRNHPTYSAGGEQCVVAEITNGADQRPSLFLVLVRTRSRP